MATNIPTHTPLQQQIDEFIEEKDHADENSPSHTGPQVWGVGAIGT
jgi:hypothetical protein